MAFELVLDPDGGSGVAVVHTAQHFGHATKVSRTVDRKEQENGALIILGLEGRVQPFVAVICGAPDLVFDTTMNVIFTEALDDKVACEKLYDECPSETILHVMKKIKKLM